MKIRRAYDRDFPAIAEVHAAAFDEQMDISEVALVDLHRRHPDFDPDLSLVAECEGRVVGHVLLVPRQLQIRGTLVRAVVLGPIGVAPPFQEQGTGGRMIRHAHRLARGLGHQMVLLLGHPGYYQRFGYRGGMFGTCEVQIPRVGIPKSQVILEERRVVPNDLSALRVMWSRWFADVDLAVIPGRSVLDWISPSKQVRSCCVFEGEQLIGYVRYGSDGVRMLLARDAASTTALLGHLAARVQQGGEMLCLPLHPHSEAVGDMLQVPFSEVVEPWDAAMIRVIDEGEESIVAYCREVAKGERSVGLVIWPVEYEVC